MSALRDGHWYLRAISTKVSSQDVIMMSLDDGKKSASTSKKELKDEMNKQSSLSHFVVKKKMDNADPKSKEFDIPIGQIIAVDDQPFSMVENPGSINWVKEVRFYNQTPKCLAQMFSLLSFASGTHSQVLGQYNFLPYEITYHVTLDSTLGRQSRDQMSSVNRMRTLKIS
uniref:Uncharacterized protein n=1 Tax=Romanomermis culicivorax TaxID=13658 RepID=A0A915L793_ROMCU